MSTVRCTNTERGERFTCGAWTGPAVSSVSLTAVHALPVRGWCITAKGQSELLKCFYCLLSIFNKSLPHPFAFRVKNYLPSLSDVHKLLLMVSCSLQVVLLLTSTGVRKHLLCVHQLVTPLHLLLYHGNPGSHSPLSTCRRASLAW